MKPKLLIVTDLGLLRAYQRDASPQGTPRLELLEEVRIDDAHRRVGDKVTDAAGRRGAPTQTNGGTPMADDHNLKLETKRRLVKEIAGHIRRLMQARVGDGVWMAAPKEINQLIFEKLPKELHRRIEVNLMRDLARSAKLELLQSFPQPELAAKQPSGLPVWSRP